MFLWQDKIRVKMYGLDIHDILQSAYLYPFPAVLRNYPITLIFT